MMRRVAAACVGTSVMVLMLHLQAGVALAQGSVQACMNPRSGEVKILVSGSCAPGFVSLELSTGGGGGDGRGPRVVDADNEDVGAFADGSVLRSVAPYWLMIPVGQQGFRTAGLDTQYLSADCSGPAYLQTAEGTLARRADLRSDDGLLHFAGDPIAVLTINSGRDVLPDGSLGATCFTFSFTALFGPETTVDPADFGLTAPFQIVDP